MQISVLAVMLGLAAYATAIPPPNNCAVNTGDVGICIYECDFCTSNQICCFNGCGSVCVTRGNSNNKCSPNLCAPGLKCIEVDDGTVGGTHQCVQAGNGNNAPSLKRCEIDEECQEKQTCGYTTVECQRPEGESCPTMKVCLGPVNEG